MKKARIWSSVIILLGVYGLWIGACAGQIHDMPKCEREDITNYCNVSDANELTDKDYENIFKQTGVTKAGMDTLLAKNQAHRLEWIQERFFQEPELETVRTNVVCHQEWITNPTDSSTTFVVEDGDIIVSLSSYLGGWRYGHCGLILDADRGTVLEAITYGEPSCIKDIKHWSEYPAYVILRPKNMSAEERQQAVSYALSDLQGIRYDLLSFKTKRSYGPIKRTHCSHLVWYAYHSLGVDLDADGTPIVTPYDIVHDDDLELVQAYGMCLDRNAYEGKTQTEGQQDVAVEDEIDLHPYDFTLTFAGDINFAEDYFPIQQLNASDGDLTKCVDPTLIEAMKSADVMWLNNEFVYSDRGAPLPGKMWTFRGNPDRVNLLKELGVDIVGLANNHVYDYGPEAMRDTLDTLQEAGIPYVGAGHDLAEAMSPVYMKIGDKTIAYVAASRAEKYQMTPQATESSPGILRCYDPELFKAAIAEAREHADFVIALPHWGTEHTAALEQVQRDTGREYLEAGADVVIGAHSHCLQGIEYVDGRAVFYSLGNYWFDDYTVDTMLVQMHVSGDDNGYEITYDIVPAVQSGCRTMAAEGEEAQRIYDYLTSISVNVDVDEHGEIKPWEVME